MQRPDISRLRKNRGTYLKIGFIFALSVTIYAFNYTVYESESLPTLELIYTPEDVVEVVRTKHEEKPLPPPPKIGISENIIEVETPEFTEEPEPIPVEVAVDVSVSTTKTSTPPNPTAPKPAPKPEAIPEDPAEKWVDVLYTRVEQMPEFGDCSAGQTAPERNQISDKNLLQFIYKNIKYPRIALENGVSGKVFVRFVVNQEGQVENAEVLREPGGGLGREVLRVIALMPPWKPGKQGSHKVKVQYTLPVEFKPL